MIRASVVRLGKWVLVLATLLGLLILGARVGLPLLSQAPRLVAEQLSQRLGADVEIGALDASWDGYYPHLRVDALSLVERGSTALRYTIDIASIDLTLDPWRSVIGLQPVFEQLEISDVEVSVYQREGTWWRVPEPTARETAHPENNFEQWLLGLILSQPEVVLADASVELHSEKGRQVRFHSVQALLENLEGEHQFSGQLRIQGLEETQLAYAVQFEGQPESALSGRFPFYLKLESLGPELFELFDLDLPLARMRAGTEFWGVWQDNALERLQGRLAVGELEYGADNPVHLTNSYLAFALLPGEELYQLQLSDIHLQSDEQSLDIPLVALEGGLDYRVPPSKVMVPELEMAPLSRWVAGLPMLPDALTGVLRELKPEGRLENTVVQWQGRGWTDFELAADARALGVEAYFGAPKIRGASGLLRASAAGGALHLDTDYFEMHFPKLYQDGWTFHAADGVVRWSLDDDAALIASDLLHLREAGVSGAGRFSILVPYDRQTQTELTLMIGLTDSDGTQTQRYTPAKEVGEGVHRWLGEAIQAGQIRQGGLVLHGGTRMLESRRPPSVNLFMDIGGGSLRYDPAWPPIEAADLFLQVRNGDLRVDLRNGRFLTSEITSGWAYKRLHDRSLQVAAAVQGPASDLEQVLRSKPLGALDQGLGDWSLGGSLGALVQLEIPVTNESSVPTVDVTGTLNQGSLRSDSLRLAIDELAGRFSYSSQAGLASGPLSAQLWGRPLSGRLSTADGKTTLSLEGRAEMQSVREWLALDALRVVQGVVPYQARVDFCISDNACRNRFELASSLTGTAVNLPLGLGKAPDAMASLALDVDLDANQLSFNYREALFGRFDLASSLPRGRISLGVADPRLPDGSGVHLSGTLEHLDLASIAALAEPAATQQLSSGGGDPVGLAGVDLSVAEFELAGYSLGPLQVKAQAQEALWSIQVAGNQVQGGILLPDEAGPIDVQLQRLYLVSEDGAPSTAQDQAGSVSWIDGNALPDIDLVLDDLRYDGRELGMWRAQVRSTEKQVRLEGIEANLAELTLSGALTWTQGQAPHTGVTVRMQGRDLGEQLVRWQLPRSIESQALEGGFQLEWDGPPWAFALENLDGAFQFGLEEGRIIESGNSANLLRVFGILNFNALGRRLRLNFSDLFEKGVAFDNLSGDYRITRGVAATEKPLRMVGPSANLQAEGQLDLGAETVDKEMEVVLPITSNVPFAAVLLGAPQVAGAVFLIDRLIGDKLEQVTTLRYRLSGDWGDPQVDLITTPPQEAEEMR
ncbi:MAG: TIGR02099 family protein [Oceanospirillaceae bacterium]|nr:TIGR02099 family protein [Oceanospirillaceae bacterium]